MHIEVTHPQNRFSAITVAPTYDVDIGPLAMPPHIFIGAKAHDGAKIEGYSMQVEEYDIWLEDQIRKLNLEVCSALELIFDKAQTTGVILTTQCCPAPYITHAHVVKRAIETLAGKAK